jgi:hypothetical protein
MFGGSLVLNGLSGKDYEPGDELPRLLYTGREFTMEQGEAGRLMLSWWVVAFGVACAAPPHLRCSTPKLTFVSLSRDSPRSTFLDFESTF